MRPVKAREARELAQAVSVTVERPDWRHAPKAGAYSELPRTTGLRPSARRVLELLLRSVDERFMVSRTTSWIARQLGLGHSTVHRARHELSAAGLIVVTTHGVGHTASVYRVRIERIRGLVGVLPGSTQTAPGEHTPLLPGSTPSAPGEHTQRGGARDAGVPVLTSNPPTPQVNHSPELVVVGGEPPTPPDSSSCRHGRRACRDCGTDRRSRERRRQQEAAEREREGARARQAQARREEEDARLDVSTAAAGIAAVRAAAGIRR